MNVVFLDVETTGLVPIPVGDDRIVEVAWVVDDLGGRTLERWESLVDARRSSTDPSRRAHGIEDAMLAGQPCFSDLAAAICARLEGAYVVGHSVGFDRAFLSGECAAAGFSLPEARWIDTRMLARKALPGRPVNLPSLAARLGISDAVVHRAMPDALLARRVFWQLYQRLGHPSMEWLADKGGPAPLRQEVLAVLREGLATGCTVIMAYDRGKKSVTREVAVHGIAGGHLRGWCYLRNAVRVLRLDRIAAASLGSRRYELSGTS